MMYDRDMTTNCSEIPPGEYCYSRDDAGNKVFCPHYHIIQVGTERLSTIVHCDFINEYSSSSDAANLNGSLLWDEIKECNLNRD